MLEMLSLLSFVMPGPIEVGICLVIAVLVFGGRLPSIMKSLGRAIPSFRKGYKEVEIEVAKVAEELDLNSEKGKV